MIIVERRNPFAAGAVAFRQGEPNRPPIGLTSEDARRWRLGWTQARVDQLSKGGKKHVTTRA